jgi:dipeptidyl aminopeptidase/acylaminoacyl peptidase
MHSNRLNKGKSLLGLVLGLMCLRAGVLAEQLKRPFTLADEIGLTLFDAQGLVYPPSMHFSPDRKYVAVWTERGRVDLNCVEDSLRFYRTQDIETFLKDRAAAAPQPVWVATLSGKRFPIIAVDYAMRWRWLPDSSSVAFSKFDAESGSQQLMLADLRKKSIEALTPPAEFIRGFDIRDRLHYVYVITDQAEWDKTLQANSQAAAFSGTGTEFWWMFFPDDPTFRRFAPAKALWAVVDGKRFEVKDSGIRPHVDENVMSLSPDGRSLAMLAPVKQVPPSWEKLYPPPPFLSYAEEGIHPQHSIKAGDEVKQYVRIDLKSGSTQPLVDAPSMGAVGILQQLIPPSWSSDGQEVLLPGTFLKSTDNAPSRPCVAIVDLRSGSSICVFMPKVGYTENTDPVDDFHPHIDDIMDAGFAPGNDRRVLVKFDTRGGEKTTEYKLQDGSWVNAGETLGEHDAGAGGLELKVTRGINDPPLLVATQKEASRVLWDPNPQLKDIELSHVSIYKWKDSTGREWEGGIYEPRNYTQGHRYPLVIQTHGFSESEFRPSGAFPTAFAAQALAANGIMVLQIVKPIGKDCEGGSPHEAPCAADVTESAARKLIADGAVDPENIGIIGFSRTCYYVMHMLTTNSLHFKAASITDGVMMDYFLYMLAPSEEPERVIGAKPFGEGRQEWLKHSPSFNLDKVSTPLLVNALSGRAGALVMWSPYSELHYLHKPVELMVFNDPEHVLSNPAARMASQGGSVDWFRFWLQGYEDPDPVKAEQYKRWRELKRMQGENDKKSAEVRYAAPLSSPN